MAQSFSRTLRSLDGERSVASCLWPLLSLLGLLAWCGWFFGARIEVLAKVDNARIEVAEAGHRLQAQVSGHVLAVHAQLDRPVTRGQVLVELDASIQERQLQQRTAQHVAVEQQWLALRREIASVERVLESQREASQAHLEEAEVRQAQAEALARVRDHEEARSLQLLNAGAVPLSDAQRSAALADQQQREAGALAVARRRISADQRLAEAERGQRLAQLHKEAAALTGALATLEAQRLELEQEIEKRKLRAPIAGRLGEIAALTVGAFVRAGEELGMVIPSGSLRIVALFPPDQAFGRIRPGQQGELRLFGFPWTQYGSVRGVVQRVASEVREGNVRVELVMNDTNSVRIPLQHGLPGSLQIEIEQTSPALLAFRAAGRGFAPVSQGATRP